MTKPVIERSIEQNAEEVRAYLVAVRGGAPFLSAADGRLLVQWLQQGFSVARILAGVDETAEKRRKKMTRGRLTLTACRRSIEGRKREIQPDENANPDKSSATGVDFSEFLADLQKMPISDPLKPAHSELLTAIKMLSGSSDPESVATAAVAACRRFHVAAWSCAEDEHDVLRTQALVELSALKNVLSPNALEAAIEEISHDIVRRRYPLVSAKEVWDRMGGQ